ncbi:cupredoxin domain-containing protein [Leucobacter sp. GX24907]
MITRRALLRGAAGIAGLTALASIAGCSPSKPEVTPSDDDAEAVVVVQAVDNSYEPAEVTVRVGEAVRWEFEGAQEHDVVSNDRSFVSELMVEGSYVHVFDSAGEFPYLCSIHPEMQGLVTVVE